MKKLLVLLVVLGLTSFANAGLIFTIDGEPQPPVITLAPSETVVLDLHLDGVQNIQCYQLTYTLSNEQAEFLNPAMAFDNVVFPWGSIAPGKVNAYDQDGICSWVEIAADNIFSAAQGPLDLMDGLILHCLDSTPVTMTVTVSASTTINGELIPVGTILHELDIIQVPEPMTIALLGLGGLLLRRRR